MKHYEEVTKEVAEKFVREITCDRCKAIIPLPVRRKHQVFRLEAYTEEMYPESGWRDGWRVDDLCRDCVDWLFQTLIDAGVHITQVQNEYA